VVEILTPDDFRVATGVSRETLARLEAYVDTLRHWQRRINLVSAASLADPWRRHMLDSAQLFPFLPPATRLLADLGSGAGFPGLVLAIMGAPRVHLIESDGRKAAFLREAARAAEAKGVQVHHARLETLAPTGADAATARACAPLDRLLGHAARHLRPGGRGLFLKGRRVDEELTAARKKWKMRVQRVPSRAEPGGVVLIIEEIERA